MSKANFTAGLRRYIGEHPLLFFNYYRMRARYRKLLVDSSTQLVIEGFPRSGNTFAVYAFEQAQHGSIRLAHHLHAPAQIMRATDLGIPCLVLIRDPSDAVPSLVIREPEITLSQAFLHYISFYGKIADLSNDFVLGPFEEVTTDYGATIERVNARFGTSFSRFQSSSENIEKVFETIESSHRARRKTILEEKIPRPSPEREARKNALKEALSTPPVESLAREARDVYRSLSRLTQKPEG